MNRLVWFRNDLRLHDNETLAAAFSGATESVACVFIYDQRWDVETPDGFKRLGLHRKRYLAESVLDLQKSLRAMGGDLICAYGDPRVLIPEICNQLRFGQVYFSKAASSDERQDEIEIQRRLSEIDIETFSFQTHSLLREEDLSGLDLRKPMSFSKFRNFVEKSWPVRTPIDQVNSVSRGLLGKQSINIRLWNFADFLEFACDSRGLKITGGESHALSRMHEYIWQGDCLRHYKETRNGLLARNDSSKFSPALALGSISPRRLYQEVRRYESERVANASTLWFLYELLWRDHFQYSSLRRGRRLFIDSIEGKSLDPEEESQRFDSWRMGGTGSRFVDAAMNELRLTGWLSNRMRQVAASFLVHDLGVDWKKGARWFESCLIDYDASSNWGNWSYIAGAGPENKPHIFNIDQQARFYDPNGDYVNHWSAC